MDDTRKRTRLRKLIIVCFASIALAAIVHKANARAFSFEATADTAPAEAIQAKAIGIPEGTP